MALSPVFHSAWARAVRTFEAAAVPVLAAALLLAQAGHATLSDGEKLIVGVIAAFLAAASAFFMDLGSVTEATPVGKALVQVAQTFGAGLATLVVANLTVAGGIALLHSVVALAAASVIAGLLVLTRSNSEQKAA